MRSSTNLCGCEGQFPVVELQQSLEVDKYSLSSLGPQIAGGRGREGGGGERRNPASGLVLIRAHPVTFD